MNTISNNSDLLLQEATVQEIQLELIRRTQFNSFDGSRITAILQKNQDLWEAVLFDSLFTSQPGQLPIGGLIKLRDLSQNHWNVDTLYILSPDMARARQLAEMAEDWGGMVHVYESQDEVVRALGSSGITSVIVSIWWD